MLDLDKAGGRWTVVGVFNYPFFELAFARQVDTTDEVILITTQTVEPGASTQSDVSSSSSASSLSFFFHSDRRIVHSLVIFVRLDRIHVV